MLAGADESQDPADTEKQAKKAVVGDLQAEAQRALNVMWQVEKMVMTETEQALLSGINPEFVTAENFGGKCAQLFKRLEKKGFIDSAPTTPLWSAENLGVE